MRLSLPPGETGVEVIVVGAMVGGGGMVLLEVVVVGGRRFSLHPSVSQHSITSEGLFVPHNSGVS